MSSVLNSTHDGWTEALHDIVYVFVFVFLAGGGGGGGGVVRV